jgi:lysophospholipase L1-like esterase
MLLPSSLFKVGDDGWNADAWNENIVKYVTPNLKNIAESRKLKTVDLFAWSLENKDVFVDGLHPMDDSYKPFAQFIYDSIKKDIAKK